MKYLYMNDVSYLMKKRLKFMILLVFIPILVLLINITSTNIVIDHINSSMGTRLVIDRDGTILIELLMYALNVFVYLFLIIDVYIKDIAYQLDNIFLRIKPVKWISKKIAILILITVILKFMQYLTITLVLLISGKSNIFTPDLVKLITNDILYILFIQFLFIFIYTLSAIFKRKKTVPYIIFLSAMIIIPKNIYELNMTAIIYILVITILILLLLIILFKKLNKQIIENI